MADQNAKTPEQPSSTPAADRVEELPQPPLSEKDAQLVKGGVAIKKTMSTQV